LPKKPGKEKLEEADKMRAKNRNEGTGMANLGMRRRRDVRDGRSGDIKIRGSHFGPTVGKTQSAASVKRVEIVEKVLVHPTRRITTLRVREVHCLHNHGQTGEVSKCWKLARLNPER